MLEFYKRGDYAMYCNKCGTEIPNGSAFCPNCGQKCDASSGVKTIQLKCKNCDGMMTVDSDAQEVICPYCGTKEKILDSDAVTIEKIKSNTYKEMEYAKMANENAQNDRNEKTLEQTSYRKSILSKVTIIFTFVCLLVMINSFKSHHIIPGLIALIQIGLFAISWLMGMQIIKENRKRIYEALAILGFILIIPFFACSGGKDYEKLDWPKAGIATNIPDPKAKYGDIIINDEDSFMASIDKYSRGDYEQYLEKCKDMGYIIDGDISTNSYEAYNDMGYKLSLSFFSDSMNIDLDAPMKMGEFSWPTSDIAKLLPTPQSNIGKIEREADDGFVIYVGNTSIEDFKAYAEEVSKAGFTVDYQKDDTYYQADNADGYHVDIQYEGNDIMCISIDKLDEEIESTDEIDETETSTETPDSEAKNDDAIGSVDPDLKAFLDEYEEFIDDYIKFMKKYGESDDTVSMLTDYTEMMSKYADFAEKLDKYDSDTMSPADAAYYIEVTTRCSKKLAEASLQ